MVNPDVTADWVNVDRWPDTDSKNRVFEVFRKLATLDIVQLGAIQGDGLPYLRFSAEAQQVFDTWRTELERRLRADDDHPVVISHLAKYRSLMPSLALLLHVIDCVDRRTGGPVSAEAARKAIAWCMYLEAHARRVYQSLTAASVTAATVLAAKLRAREVPTPFRVRTVRLKGWAGLTDGETIELGLELLEELGWVRRVDVKPSVRGGRPTVEYLVNPAVMASIKGSPFPEGFGGFGGGSPQGNPLARAGSTLTESSSSSSSSPPRSDIPTPSPR